MKTVNRIVNKLSWLFGLYDGDIFDEVDVNEMDEVGRQEEYEMRGKNRMLFLDKEEISIAIIRRLESSCDFEVCSPSDVGMDYKGNKLFPHGASRIYSEYSSSSFYGEFEQSYYYELWMMEDGRFVVVEHLEMMYVLDERYCEIHYRKKLKIVRCREDLDFFDSNYLWGQFYNMQNDYPDMIPEN